ncbi:MAG: D-glycerate dehydrogenase [Pseudomonadota bacterium]
MRAFLTRPLPEPVIQAARAEIADLDVRDVNTPLSESEAAALMARYDVILPTLGDAFRSAAFEGIPRCRLLANFGVGYNHIDVAAAAAAGVAVTNTPGAVTEATADIALMLMLMSCRRAGEGERLVRAGRWDGWHPTQMLGLHMSGKTLGVIGMGRIGQAIARRAHHGFGMTVVFQNRSPKVVEGVPSEQLRSIPEVMGRADIVVISVPGSADTHHLIGAAELAAMQPHAHLINIARGDVVDEAALIAALECGVLAGAGLDVYESEPEVPSALFGMENVVLLPHLGTAALEVRIAMGMMAVDNIAAFVAGKTLPNPV